MVPTAVSGHDAPLFPVLLHCVCAPSWLSLPRAVSSMVSSSVSTSSVVCLHGHLSSVPTRVSLSSLACIVRYGLAAWDGFRLGVCILCVFVARISPQVLDWGGHP